MQVGWQTGPNIDKLPDPTGDYEIFFAETGHIVLWSDSVKESLDAGSHTLLVMSDDHIPEVEVPPCTELRIAFRFGFRAKVKTARRNDIFVVLGRIIACGNVSLAVS